MEEFSRKERRRLRDLAGTAHERELDAALEELDSEFERWRSDELLPSELSERIHEFHDGGARELYSIYNRLEEEQLVARAVAHGLLDEEEVGSDLLPRLEEAIE